MQTQTRYNDVCEYMDNFHIPFNIPFNDPFNM